jgi:hypothetical protein
MTFNQRFDGDGLDFATATASRDAPVVDGNDLPVMKALAWNETGDGHVDLDSPIC